MKDCSVTTTSSTVLNFEVDGDFFKKVAIDSVSAIIILRFYFFFGPKRKKKRRCFVIEEIYRCCYLHKVRSRTHGLCVRTRVFFCTTTSTIILCLAPCGISYISLHKFFFFPFILKPPMTTQCSRLSPMIETGILMSTTSPPSP